MGDWLNHNTDKILLYSLVLLAGYIVIHIVHHGGDQSALAWAENAFSTVLGALILLLTGRIPKPNGGTSNGTTTVSSSSTTGGGSGTGTDTTH